jgi:hypothetical protein
MLTGKDYCDYETCVALKELGYDGYCAAYYHLFDDEDDARNSFEYAYGFDFQNSNNIYRAGAPLLYQAQKWLRDENGLFVNVELFGDYDRDADGKTLGTWVYYSYGILNTKTADFIREYDLCTEYQTYEDALSEGIKEAVKILKENEDE